MTEAAAPTLAGSEDAIAPVPPTLSRGRSIAVLVALLLGLLLGALDNFIVATVLPFIASDLHNVNGQVFVVTSYLIAQTVAIPIFGKLSDRFGRRTFYLLGLAIFLIGSTLSGVSQNLNELIAFRAIQGLGSGAFFTVVFSIVADLFPPKAAARLAGILSGVFGIAIVAGPLMGSYIVDHSTWRWIFFVNLPIGFAAIALVLLSLGPLRPTAKAPRFDALGAALLSGWVTALILALVETSNGWAWTDFRTEGLLAIAIVLCPLFVWQESRAEDPLVPLHFFRIPLVAAASGVNFLRGAVLVAVVTFVPIFVQLGLGGSVDVSRDVLYAFMVPMIIGAAMGGQLVTRFGYRLPVAIGVALCTVGCLLLTAVPVVPPIFRFEAILIPVGLAGALIPIGLGIGLTFAPTQLAIQYSVPKKDVGTGSSLVWFLSNLGGSIVVSLLGSYQVSVLKANYPGGIPPPLTDPPSAAYLAYYAQVMSAWANSIHVLWPLVVVVSLAALAFAFLVRGVLPRTADEASEVPLADSASPN
jgi:EmrB/QacA subfamily drug resistance transporter